MDIKRLSNYTTCIVWNTMLVMLCVGFCIFGISMCKDVLKWIVILKACLSVLLIILAILMVIMCVKNVKKSEGLSSHEKMRSFVCMVITTFVEFLTLYFCGFFTLAVVIVVLTCVMSLITDCLDRMMTS